MPQETGQSAFRTQTPMAGQPNSSPQTPKGSGRCAALGSVSVWRSAVKGAAKVAPKPAAPSVVAISLSDTTVTAQGSGVPSSASNSPDASPSCEATTAAAPCAAPAASASRQPSSSAAKSSAATVSVRARSPKSSWSRANSPRTGSPRKCASEGRAVPADGQANANSAAASAGEGEVRDSTAVSTGLKSLPDAYKGVLDGLAPRTKSSQATGYTLEKVNRLWRFLDRSNSGEVKVADLVQNMAALQRRCPELAQNYSKVVRKGKLTRADFQQLLMGSPTGAQTSSPTRKSYVNKIQAERKSTPTTPTLEARDLSTPVARVTATEHSNKNLLSELQKVEAALGTVTKDVPESPDSVTKGTSTISEASDSSPTAAAQVAMEMVPKIVDSATDKVVGQQDGEHPTAAASAAHAVGGALVSAEHAVEGALVSAEHAVEGAFHKVADFFHHKDKEICTTALRTLDEPSLVSHQCTPDALDDEFERAGQSVEAAVVSNSAAESGEEVPSATVAQSPQALRSYSREAESNLKTFLLSRGVWGQGKEGVTPVTRQEDEAIRRYSVELVHSLELASNIDLFILQSFKKLLCCTFASARQQQLTSTTDAADEAPGAQNKADDNAPGREEHDQNSLLELVFNKFDIHSTGQLSRSDLEQQLMQRFSMDSHMSSRIHALLLDNDGCKQGIIRKEDFISKLSRLD